MTEPVKRTLQRQLSKHPQKRFSGSRRGHVGEAECFVRRACEITLTNSNGATVEMARLRPRVLIEVRSWQDVDAQPERQNQTQEGQDCRAVPDDPVACRSLSGEAIAAFVEFGRIHNGANNGSLAPPTHTLARLRGCSNDTAARAIRALVERGFVEIVRASGFNVKSRLAAEYRLTLHRCDATGTRASKAFMRWRPESKTQSGNVGATVRKTTVTRGNPASQSNDADYQPKNEANHSPIGATHVDSPMQDSTHRHDPDAEPSAAQGEGQAIRPEVNSALPDGARP